MESLKAVHGILKQVGSVRAQEWSLTIFSLWNVPKTLIGAHLSLWKPEASKRLNQTTMVGITVVSGILEKVGSV